MLFRVSVCVGPPVVCQHTLPIEIGRSGLEGQGGAVL